MKFSARILGFLVALTFVLITAKISFAQTPTPITQQSPQYLAPNTESNVPQNLHTFTQSTMIEVMSAIICQIGGVDPINPTQKCLGINSKTNKIGYTGAPGGLLGFAAQGIGSLYTSPIHTGDYVRYLSQNFGFAKPSYAQTLGIDALSPLVPIWSIFRNLAYLVFVIAFILIGLGVMLRVRIDPRTVMTIQNQIPKIIIALILITFSFAIVGFLIDLMFISMYLIFNLFSGLGGGINAFSPANIQGQTILNAANGLHVFDVVSNVAVAGKDSINDILIGPGSHTGPGGGAGSIMDTLGSIFNISGTDWLHFSVVEMIYNLISLTTALKLTALIPCLGADVPLIGGLLCAGQTALTGTPIYLGIHFFFTDIFPFLLIWLIVMVAVLVTLFRVLLMLLRAYVSLLLDTIFAPLWIMGGLIPGTTSVGFVPWLKDVASNLAVFPAVYGMLLLANVLGHALSTNAAQNGAFAPPFLGNSLAPGFIGAVTSLGLILMTPHAAQMVKSAFKAPKVDFGFGGAIGSAVGIINTPVRKISGGLFGKNPYTQQPRQGSVMLGKFVRSQFGNTGGNLASIATGAGRIKDAATGKPLPFLNSDPTALPGPVGRRANRIRQRLMKRSEGNAPQGEFFEGPVRREDKENRFRTTGETIGKRTKGSTGGRSSGSGTSGGGTPPGGTGTGGPTTP